jgi:hypothetical protein
VRAELPGTFVASTNALLAGLLTGFMLNITAGYQAGA